MKSDDPLAEYVGIVHSRRNDPIPDNEYGEIHHIIPRSCGGSNDSWNLVRLTPEEHYRCHELLPFIYTSGQEHKSMVHAWVLMGGYKKTDENLYGVLKREHSKCMKGNKHFLGKHHSEETRNRISSSRKGLRPSEETRKKMSEWHKNHVGWHMSEETKKKISEAKKRKGKAA